MAPLLQSTAEPKETLEDLSLKSFTGSFLQPAEIAKELFIAATLFTRGLDIAHRRVPADIPLLTNLALSYIESCGYVEGIPYKSTADENGTTARQLVRSSRSGHKRLLLLGEGRTPWGVSIASLDPLADSDLTRAVQFARSELARRIEAAAAKLRKPDEIERHTDSMERAILRSTNSYEEALQACRLDPAYTMSILDKIYAS